MRILLPAAGGLVLIAFAAVSLAAPTARRQDNSKPGTPAAAAAPAKKLTIEVSGGDKDVPVENASVYLKFDEERLLRKDKKFALNVKTNREGSTHIPDVPQGRVLIQVVAEGWKTFGKYYEITDQGATIKIHLDRPPKWY